VKIIAFDTGDTTGIASWNGEKVQSWALPREEAEDFAAHAIPEADQVITEQLVISMATAKKGRQVQDAIEMVGLIRALCRWYKTPLYDKSKPGEVMNFISNEKLKRLDLYVPGPDHENDARRHLVTWLVEHGVWDRSILLKKEETDEGGPHT